MGFSFLSFLALWSLELSTGTSLRRVKVVRFLAPFTVLNCTSKDLWIINTLNRVKFWLNNLVYFFSGRNDRWWEEVECNIHNQCRTKAWLFHLLVAWGHHGGETATLFCLVIYFTWCIWMTFLLILLYDFTRIKTSSHFVGEKSKLGYISLCYCHWNQR